METGLLWFDNDLKTELTVKISQAAIYYQNKYGQKPNLCFVHPSMLKNIPELNDIEIRSNRKLLPDHLWLGIQ